MNKLFFSVKFTKPGEFGTTITNYYWDSISESEYEEDEMIQVIRKRNRHLMGWTFDVQRITEEEYNEGIKPQISFYKIRDQMV